MNKYTARLNKPEKAQQAPVRANGLYERFAVTV